jgi:hypothetical protein
MSGQERNVSSLKYYLIPKSDKSQMWILQRNCNVKNQAHLQTYMEISSCLSNHAFKHFNIILICYLLTKFAQSRPVGPLITFIFLSFSINL